MADDSATSPTRRKPSKIPKISTDNEGFTSTEGRTTRRSILKAAHIKKPEIPTSNVFEILSDPEDIEIDENSANEPVTQQKFAQRPMKSKESSGVPKPIIVVSTTFNALTNAVSSLSLSKQPTFTKRNGKDFTVQAATVDDKKKIVQKLNSINLQHFSYTENSDRHLMFALLGHHETSADEILKELIAANIPAVKVSRANKSDENPIFIVSFAKASMTLNELQSKHSTINSLRIKWDKHRPRSRRPTQCHRCQRFGHAAINCSLPYRCVKCLESHEPGKCSRSSPTEGVPSCVNCNQEGHTSNSSTCPEYIKYTQRIAAKKPRLRQPVPREYPASRYDWEQNRHYQNNFSSPPFAASQHAPSTSQSSQIVNRNNSEYRPPLRHPVNPEAKNKTDFFSQISIINNEIMSLPGMKKTLEIYSILLEDLKRANSHADRISVLLKHAELNSTPFTTSP